ncbi:GtrA family protein [Mesorhizobium sp. WSM3860]|uniref:GtrA family protein n=1 Tax=Mesorhizobium sp. WSM3860 TaxID=2029403 RepID=UPI000BAEC69A|nr:GtrA family protein [Mesorhizobium sp. WSM3860]PBC05079.1 hypothetical protein CK220_08855 [Mesorhizobium sp. WSM3860]
MPGPALNTDEQVRLERRASGRPLLERGWRYTLVGLVCAIAHNVVMIVVDHLGGHYLVGILVSFLSVTPIGYSLHSWFTFAEPLRLKAFMRFVAGVVAAYPVSVAMMVVLCSGLNLSVPIATPIATVALFVWNFVAAHWAILPRLYLQPATLPTSPRRPAKHQSTGKEE